MVDFVLCLLYPEIPFKEANKVALLLVKLDLIDSSDVGNEFVAVEYVIEELRCKKNRGQYQSTQNVNKSRKISSICLPMDCQTINNNRLSLDCSKIAETFDEYED